MNPISALRSISLPDLQSLPALQNLPASLKAAAGKLPTTIPAAELQQLGNSITTQKYFPSATLSPNSDTRPVVGAAGPAGASFGDLLGQMVSEVNTKGAAASEKVTGLLSGQDATLHQTMISMEEASVSFQLMIEVRNKLLESYQELMRMQI